MFVRHFAVLAWRAVIGGEAARGVEREHMSLSEYEQRVLREITERKAQQVARSPRRIVPEPVKERAGDLAHLVGGVRGVGTLRDKAAPPTWTLSAGASRAVSRLSSSSLSEDRILRAYRRRGVEVSSLEDVRALDLHQVERRVKPKRMDLVYASLAAAEGAAAGAVITGGEVLATGGSGGWVGRGWRPGGSAPLRGRWPLTRQSCSRRP